MKCPIPLYHGTNSFFLPGIKANGLGAKNPLIEMDTYGCFEILYKKLEEAYKELTDPKEKEKWYPAVRMGEAFYKQTVTRGNMNFRHGQTYLTAYKYRAKGYAQGSEHLRQLFIINDFLYIEKVLKDYKEVISQFQLINDYWNKPVTPVVVTVKKNILDDNSLNTESGDPSTPDIKLITERLEEHKEWEKIPILRREVERISEPTVPQRITFELTDIVDSKNLEFEVFSKESFKIEDTITAK